MERHRILVVDPIDETAIDDLRQRYDVVVHIRPAPDELTTLLRDVDAVVLRSGVRLTGPMIRGSGRLRVVARAGVGVDNVDTLAARDTGVLVFNVPGESSWSVAELAIGLLLALARRICLADRQVRTGSAVKAALIGGELRGSRLGVVGLGRVGGNVATLGAALGMTVLASVRRDTEVRRQRLAADHIQLVSLPELLAEADAIVLAVPLTPRSAGLIGAAELRTMKPSAILVNVSRGALVDEAALLDALTSGGLAGAALDVGGSEQGNSPLAVLDNVVLTPHLGGMTTQAQRRIGAVLVDSIGAALTGKPVPYRVA